ncbi:MAG: LLM class flavin-dependent oxidoreductase [Acidimicrobiia bacterium]
MKVGIAMGPAPPFAPMARRVAKLSDAGFGSFWWPDHLVAFHSRELWATGGLAEVQPDPNVYADPFVCMAACAASTPDGLLGVCVTDAIRRMPATLAQTVMTLDHLAPGRIVLGLGAGELANYGPYGLSVKSPATVLENAAAQIRRLIDDPGPDEAGAVLGIRPPEGSRGPQLWLAAHGPRGLAATGRYADGWIPNWLPVEGWRAGRDAVARAAQDAGRDPSVLTYALSVQVVVQPTHEQAVELLEHPVLKAFALLLPPERFAEVGAEHPLEGGGLHHMVASAMGAEQLEAARAVPSEVVRSLYLHGTPAEVVEQIRAYGDPDHVVLWDPVPLADLSAGRAAGEGCAEIVRLLA